MPSTLTLLLTITTLTTTLLLLTLHRLHTILTPRRNKPLRHGRRHPHEPTHLLLLLGSGGHTTELISMLTRAVTTPTTSPTGVRLDWRDFTHRTWVVQEGDPVSAARAREFEEMVQAMVDGEGPLERVRRGKVKVKTDAGPGTWKVVTVPRARRVRQGVWTAPVSCLRCFGACWGVLRGRGVREEKKGDETTGGRDFCPDLILCNGPASAVVLVLASVALRFGDVGGCFSEGKLRTVYVESFARVKGLSLSGEILSRCTDRFLVQWPQLERRLGGRAEFKGVLV